MANYAALLLRSRGSQRLVTLAQQLRSYTRSPSPPQEDEDDGTQIEKGQVGIPESASSVVVDRFIPRRASVLICLFEGDHGDLRVLLTKRSSGLSTHSGEVSLPGGKTEEGDADDIDTATREAKEEIGLDPSLVNVVTVLEPFPSKHLMRVVPVIGILHDKDAFEPVPSAHEVESVFDAPLEMFLKDENRREEAREWMGEKYLIHFFDYEAENHKYLIWGLTAGILIRAAAVVFQRPPAFVEQKLRFRVPTISDDRTAMTLP